MSDRREKVGRFQAKQVGNPADRTLRFIGTDESEDRDGDIIKSDGWLFENYKKNPVFLWCHDSWSVPLGKCVAIGQAPGATGTTFDIKFASIDELSSDPEHPSDQALLADTVYNAYLNGYLNAVSVGFIGLKSEENDSDKDLPSWQRGRVFTEQEMIELSGVAIPANPNALVQSRSFKGMKPEEAKILSAILIKSALPYKKFPLADKDATWDGPAVIKASDIEDLAKICTWKDSSKDAADLTKGDFKLPHHESAADGYKTVWAGVKAAMGALLGARGGADIPEGDREGVYNHLKKHYAEFDEEAPELKSYSATELKAMFPEEGVSLKVNMKDFEGPIAEAVAKAIEPYVKQIEALKKQMSITGKTGARLSADSVEKLTKAMDHLMAGHSVLKGLMDGSGEEPEGQSQSTTTPGTDLNGQVPAPADMDDDGDNAGSKSASGASGKSSITSHGIDLSKVDFKLYESA